MIKRLKTSTARSKGLGLLYPCAVILSCVAWVHLWAPATANAQGPASSAPEPVERERIAVLQLLNRAEFKPDEVGHLTNIIRQTLSTRGGRRFLVMTQENILKLLPPDRKLEDCVGECEVETGRLLQARYIVTGDIIKFGDSLRLSVRFHETTDGALIAAKTAKGTGISEIETSLEQASNQLFEELSKRLKAEDEARAAAERAAAERAAAERAAAERAAAERAAAERAAAERARQPSKGAVSTSGASSAPVSEPFYRRFFLHVSPGVAQCNGTRAGCGGSYPIMGSERVLETIFKTDNAQSSGFALAGGLGISAYWGDAVRADKIQVALDFSLGIDLGNSVLIEYGSSYTSESTWDRYQLSLIPSVSYSLSLSDESAINLIGLDFMDLKFGYGWSWLSMSAVRSELFDVDGRETSLSYSASVFKIGAYTGYRLDQERSDSTIIQLGPYVEYITASDYTLTGVCANEENDCEIDAPNTKPIIKPGLLMYGLRLQITP